MKKLSFVLVFTLLLSGISAMAQEPVGQSEAMGFLRIVRDPALAGMGGAGKASVSNVAYAAFGNPAAIPFADDNVNAGASYSNFAGSDNIQGGAAIKLGRVGITAGYVREIGKSIDFGDPVGSYAPWNQIIGAGASFAITNWLSLGVGANFARQQLLSDYALNAAAFSAMAQLHLGALNVAAGVAGLGAGVKSEGGNTSPLPASALVSASYRLGFGRHAIDVAADADYYFSGKAGVSAGLSYSYNDFAFVRLGGRFGSASMAVPTHISIGAGVQFLGISLNLAFLTANKDMGNIICGGVGVSF